MKLRIADIFLEIRNRQFGNGQPELGESSKRHGQIARDYSSLITTVHPFERVQPVAFNEGLATEIEEQTSFTSTTI